MKERKYTTRKLHCMHAGIALWQLSQIFLIPHIPRSNLNFLPVLPLPHFYPRQDGQDPWGGSFYWEAGHTHDHTNFSLLGLAPEGYGGHQMRMYFQRVHFECPAVFRGLNFTFLGLQLLFVCWDPKANRVLPCLGYTPTLGKFYTT